MSPCSVKRCKRRQYVVELCKVHAKAKANRLFSEYIRKRDGGCMAMADDGPIECSGYLQCAHIFGKGAYPSVRWNPLNAVALCQGHHMYWTVRPLEWTAWAEQRLGREYDKLRKLALEGERPDLGHIIAFLEAA